MIDREIIVAVNEQDEPVGYFDKMDVHKKGILHRAVSVFVFSTDGHWLLQKRATSKYHSAGLWSNTACSHPLKDENVADSAHRRLIEEMGLDLVLKKEFSFTYRAEFANGLIEHELDHVFVGFTDDEPVLNEKEASDYRWFTTKELAEEVKLYPEKFTVWFRLLFPKIKELV